MASRLPSLSLRFGRPYAWAITQRLCGPLQVTPASLSAKTIHCLSPINVKFKLPPESRLVSRSSALNSEPPKKLSTEVDYSGKRNLRQYKSNWSEQTLTVSCCPDLYAPKPDGIQMNVVYIDTGYDLSSAEKTKVATVILAHGAGQTHKDMLPLAENLAQEGFRVVVPNFPGETIIIS